MVKLKLNAIKSGSTPANKTATKTQPADTGVTQKPAEAPQLQAAKQTVTKPAATQMTPATQTQSNSITPEDPATTDEPKVRKKMTLGGIKKVEKKEVVVEEVKKIEPEVFPIGASCELKNIELFPAYTSKFKKKQGSLLQNIKKLKRIPRTNKVFVFSIIGLTIFIIGGLFIFSPEKHNLDNYKTSLLDTYKNITSPEEVTIQPEPITQEEVIIDNPETEEETIDKDINEDEDEEEDSNIENSNIEDIDQILEKDTEYYSQIKDEILGNTSDTESEQEDISLDNEQNIITDEIVTEEEIEAEDLDEELEGEDMESEFDDFIDGTQDEIGL